MKPGLAVLAVLAAAGTAAAQSKRYPEAPVDAEAAAEAKSDFWEEVVRPGAKDYEDIVKKATEAMRTNSLGAATRHLESLQQATRLRPDLVEAWGYLGLAAERSYDWALCADAYAHAHAIDPRWRPSRLAGRSDSLAQRAVVNRPVEVGLAMCLSRVGKLTLATTALEALVARGEATGEAWLRLGEVYMAEGRLAEAITALGQARIESAQRPYARWLLAVAYDRARRPSDADSAAAELGNVMNVVQQGDRIPFVPAADVYYVRAFAARNTPEESLAFYRLYLEHAPPDSPWRIRAAEHVEALSGVDLAARVAVEGSAKTDRAAVERVARAAMPQLRACVADLPTALIHLRVTQIGPAARSRPPTRATATATATIRVGPGPRLPAAPTPYDRALAARTAGGGGGSYRARVVAPADPIRPIADTPGVSATATVLEPGTHDNPAYLSAIDCIEKIGLSLTLPRPQAGTYSTIRIPVVADR